MDLQRALAPSMHDLPIPITHKITHKSHTQPSSTKLQTKLDSHFTVTKPTSTPTQLQQNQPNQPTHDDDLQRPIHFQHRLTESYPNDQSWLGLQISRKPKHVARLWSHNVNGIKRNNNFLQFSESLEALTQFIQCICM